MKLFGKILCLLFILFSGAVYSEEAQLQPGLEKQLKSHIRFDSSTQNTVGFIEIGGRDKSIGDDTWLYVKQALEYYKQNKPIFVILKLNTPGGEVFAAQKISDALKNFDTQQDIPVVAFIDNWAISAGAMIAYSCRFIAVVKDASMGAAEPVLASQTGEMKEASEKVNSALRSDFANKAGFFDRNPYIAEAMVDKDIILVMREGKIIKVDAESDVKPSDTLISAKGKLLTLNAKQLFEYGVADILLATVKLPEVLAEEKETGKWPASKTALFQAPFFNQIPNAMIDQYQMDWKTLFFVVLANPIVSSLLFLGMMMGFYLEMNTPGFGFAGSIAVLCLFFIVLSSFSLEIASWLEVILFLGGIAAILLDLFLIPTFGILGITGVILALAGLLGIMLPGIGSIQFDFDSQTFNAAGNAFFNKLVWLCGAMAIGFTLILVLARFVSPSFVFLRRFVLLGDEQESGKGYVAGYSKTKLPSLGSKGTAFTPLRISGKILIEDTVYDAVSSGEFIEKNDPIVISSLNGNVIVVDLDKG